MLVYNKFQPYLIYRRKDGVPVAVPKKFDTRSLALDLFFLGWVRDFKDGLKFLGFIDLVIFLIFMGFIVGKMLPYMSGATTDFNIGTLAGGILWLLHLIGHGVARAFMIEKKVLDEDAELYGESIGINEKEAIDNFFNYFPEQKKAFLLN